MNDQQRFVNENMALDRAFQAGTFGECLNSLSADATRELEDANSDDGAGAGEEGNPELALGSGED